MQPMRCRSNKKVWIKSEGAVGSGIGFNEPSANSVRIYLLVPRRIQRVGKVNAFSVTTYLHHLRTTIERGTRFFRKGRTTYNSADLKHRRKLRAIRDGDIITAQFAGSPAGYVKPFIIKRQVKVGNERWNRFEALQQSRQKLRIRRFSRNFDHFCCAPMTIIAFPQPNRRRKVRQRNDNSGKAECLGRVMRRSQFEDHLMFLTKIDRLLVLPLSKVPNVQLVTVAAGK